MKLAAMICKLDRFLEIWQIAQCNLQIGFANWPDWTEQIYFTYYFVVVVQLLVVHVYNEPICVLVHLRTRR